MVKLSFPSLPTFVSQYRSRYLLLFPLPLVLGIAAKLLHSKLWFGDYQAVACAGQKALAGQPLYDLNLACAGMHPSVYVYVPCVARLAALCQMVMGEPGLFALYLGLFVVAVLALVIVPFMRGVPGTWRDKLPFTALWSGSVIMWGNIAVILHGVILLTALTFETLPWLFIAVVAVAAWVKPVFLSYLAIVLVSSHPFRKRLIMMVVGMTAGLVPTLLFSLSGGALADQWAAILSHFVYDTTPGYGYFGWLSLVGINGDSALVQAGYIVMASLLSLSGLCLAEGLKLDHRERLWLGLSLAVLLIPRIMSQDVLLIGPGLMIIARRTALWAASRPKLNGARSLSPVLRHGRHIVLGLCSLALLGGLTGLSDYLTPLSIFGMSLYVVWLGKTLLLVRRRTLTNLLWPSLRSRILPGE